jgi:hypothetical protein
MYPENSLMPQKGTPRNGVNAENSLGQITNATFMNFENSGGGKLSEHKGGNFSERYSFHSLYLLDHKFLRNYNDAMCCVVILYVGISAEPYTMSPRLMLLYLYLIFFKFLPII